MDAFFNVNRGINIRSLTPLPVIAYLYYLQI